MEAAKRIHGILAENKREAQILPSLDHANIVRLLGVVDEGIDFFLILEYCEGGSLREYLNRRKEQRLGQQFYDWAKQAAKPIEHLKKDETGSQGHQIPQLRYQR